MVMAKRKTVDKKAIGAELKRLREAADLTQEKAAERLGIPISTLRNWEQGRTAPSLFVVKQLKAAYKKKSN